MPRHGWRCDVCGRFLTEGAIRCLACSIDVQYDERRRERLEARVAAILSAEPDSKGR